MSFLTSLLVVGVLILGVVVFLYLRGQTGQGAVGGGNKKEASKKSSKSKTKAANSYRAVSIQAGLLRCEAVEAVEGRRYLVEENDVPELPLGSCSADNCECKYIHHKDRRDVDDRRSIIGTSGNLHVQTGQEERRERRGRRKTDME